MKILAVLLKSILLSFFAALFLLSFTAGFMVRNVQNRTLTVIVHNTSPRDVAFGYTSDITRAGRSDFGASITAQNSCSHVIAQGNLARTELHIQDGGHRIVFHAYRELMWDDVLLGSPVLELKYDGDEISVLRNRPRFGTLLWSLL
jgi:hypothetical protein